MEYDLLDPKVFEKMRQFEWFKLSISLAYRRIARGYDCTIIMSETRLIQAHDVFWEDADNGRMRHLPDGTESLDQYKMSAYLCFWLRRINPIRDAGPLHSLGTRKEWLAGTDRQSRNVENFVLYGNEICALTIAIQLSQYLSMIAAPVAGSLTPIASAGKFISSIDHGTTIEFAKILKHKNISSHGLNMALQMMNRVGSKVVEI
jgi:hypothetical protein